MELRQIELFVVLVQHRSFTRAAQALDIAQPALSQQVKRLEQELGLILLDRSTRPFRLTDAGSAFHVRAARILAEAALARQEMREFAGGARGSLVVGALPALATLWLPPILGTFHAKHPGVEISLRKGKTEELRDQVALGVLDVALLHSVPGLAQAAGGPTGIVMERLFDEELVAIVPPRHPLAKRRSVSLTDMRREAFVLVRQGSGLSHTILGSAANLGFKPELAAEAADVAMVRSLVAAGLGVSIMPRLPAEAAGPKVAVLALAPPLASHTTAMAWRGDSHPAASTEALLEMIRRHTARSVPSSAVRGSLDGGFRGASPDAGPARKGR